MSNFEDIGNSELTRRDLLKTGIQGAVGLSAVGWLAACGGGGGGASTQGVSGVSEGAPKRGGSLVMTMITGGSSETLVPGLAVTEPDIVRSEFLFDPLFRLAPDLTAEPSVAESAEPNGDGTLWTIRVRDGAVWHDGRAVDADDIVYSIGTWLDPKQNYVAATLQRLFDVKGIRKRDARTVEIPMMIPVGDLPIVTAFYGYSVLPKGATPKTILSNPVGTGPWKFKSFEPGSRSVFTANRNYWVHDGPYIDELTIDSSFTDETARLNSLLSGQSQVMQAMPFAIARRQKEAGQVNLLQSSGTSFQCFAMRTDSDAFKDVRVRQAMRLIPDRQQFVDQILNGFGNPGNDVPCSGAKYYDDSFKPEQDVEQAKSLLQAAGQEGLTVRLDTSNVLDGLVDAAALFKEQAKAAGVNVEVNRIDPSTYFSVTPGRWLSYPFSATYWVNGTASLVSYYLNVLSKDAPYNETAWTDPQSEKLLFEAIGAVDQAEAQQKWSDVQRLQFEQGGYLIYANQDYVDGLSKQVMGAKPSRAAWLTGFHINDYWLA